MINFLRKASQCLKSIDCLVEEINEGAQETVSSIKRNGVILDTIKKPSYTTLDLPEEPHT